MANEINGISKNVQLQLDENGNTWLLSNIHEGNNERALRNIISSPDSINFANNYGVTPLILAAHRGNADIVNAILATPQGRESITFTNPDSDNALLFASTSGNKDIVEAIIATPEGRTLINIPNREGDTPLLLATAWGHNDSVSSILATPEGIANLGYQNKKGETPLAAAVFHNRVEIFNQILATPEGRATLSIKDNNGNTPLLTAATNNRENAVKSILSTKEGVATVGYKDKNGATALVSAAYNNNCEVVDQILTIPEGRATLGVQDNYGNTALLTAALSEKREMVDSILRTEEGRATVNIRNNSGFTPVMSALYFSKTDNVTSLSNIEGVEITDADIKTAREFVKQHPDKDPAKDEAFLTALSAKKAEFDGRQTQVEAPARTGEIAQAAEPAQAETKADIAKVELAAVRAAAKDGTVVVGKDSGVNKPEDVATVQDALTQAGLLAQIPDSDKGTWGPKSDKALREFQEQVGLTTDGKGSRLTLAALESYNQAGGKEGGQASVDAAKGAVREEVTTLLADNAYSKEIADKSVNPSLLAETSKATGASIGRA